MKSRTAEDAALERSWARMVARCHGPKPDPRCAGQSVHDAWRNNYEAFRHWVSTNLGPRPEGAYLKRIDSKGDFAPGNLRWEDPRALRAPSDTTGEEPRAKVSVTADGRFRALLTLGTFGTEREALAMASDVLVFMRDNYSPDEVNA